MPLHLDTPKNKGYVRHIAPFVALIALGSSLLLSGLFSGLTQAAVPTGNASLQSGGGSSGDTPFDCSRVYEMGIDKQMNLRASQIMVACGYATGGSPSSSSGPATQPFKPLAPANYGGTDANTILPDGTSPHVTQSESFVWGNGSTIVANYNDSRTAPNCYAGISYSIDGGTTWQHGGQQLCSGHGTNYGDPIVVYNARLNTWFAGDLATGCGGQGIGFWTSPDGINWTTGVCAHNGANDDRESMWVDNNPASPFYGRMYVAWNNFTVSRLQAVFSDNGTTWSAPVTIQTTTSFVRDGQVTGSPNGDGAVFVSGHTESTTDTTYMFRSTNGGVNWTQLTVNTYSPAGSTAVSGCSGFRAISPIWRAPEWGQPAVSGQIVGQNVVHYVYAAIGAGGDLGDVYYVRSTDNGSTWAAPLKMNTDATTQPQWQPSLSASVGGGVMVGWYDRRNTTNGTNYEYFGRASTDNGTTWQSDQAVSDQLITQPLQPDANVQACYAGDYNYHSSFGSTAYLTWADGRNQVAGQNQQDLYFDQVSLGGTPTPTATGTPPTNTPTSTPTNTRTNTPTNTPTNTLTVTNTRTNTPTNTSTRTPTITPTVTDTSTDTPTSTATSTPTDTPTNTPVGVIIGHLTWQSIPQPNARSIQTGTLTLCVGGAPQDYSFTTDASGFFTVTTGLPDGSYNYYVKGIKWLANSGNLVISGGSARPEMGTLRGGDANNDNTVGATDFGITRATFGKSPGDPGYDARADFNNDGPVNTQDYNLVKGNFGQAGATLACP